MGCSRDSPSRKIESVGDISFTMGPFKRLDSLYAPSLEGVNVSPDRPTGTPTGMALTVAVTGPTGDIGISAVEALERAPEVERIIGMARSPFDPAAHGWTRTEYRQGDITDRDAVDALVADADVVVHLAFIIMGSREESARVNLEGTRNVFEATVAADRPRRLVYTSSVAAYGYHSDNPVPITEDVPAARVTRALLLRAEGGLRSRTGRDHRRLGARGVRAAPVHRRRTEGARAGRGDAVEPAAGPGQAAPPRCCRCSSRRSRTPARRCSWSTTTTSPPQSRLAATTSAPPGAYNIAGRRRAVDVGRGRRSRCASRPGTAGRGVGGVGGHRPPAVRAIGAGVAARRPHVSGDGHHQGEVELGWEPKYTAAETLSALGEAI